MPNYNSTLQSNNTDLQAILDSINALPEAGGVEQATPVISINSANGLITATAGTKSSTHQLAFQPTKTITPSTASQIAVSSGYYTGGDIIIAGDSNLVAENIKSGVSIFGVSGNLVEGSGGGSGEQAEWSANEDAIVNRTISNYFNDRVTTIGNSAFNACSRLTTVSFPAVTTIGSNAFANCSRLTTVSFPIVTTIGSNAFFSCIKLTTVSFPVATTIGNSAFRYCSSLTTASFPAVTTIGSSAFSYCIKLTTVSFPVATTIGSSAFDTCSRLTTVSFPAVTTIGDYAFRYCYNLSEFYLAGSSVCKLSGSNTFASTPFKGYSASFSGTPYIYVPASLIKKYQSATNWAYFSSYFSAIENAGGSNMITFTTSGVEYQAEEGMTWAEWCDSEYNTDNQFFIGRDDKINYRNNQGYGIGEVHYNNILVLSNNEIIQDAAYKIVSPGSGD